MMYDSTPQNICVYISYVYVIWTAIILIALAIPALATLACVLPILPANVPKHQFLIVSFLHYKTPLHGVITNN